MSPGRHCCSLGLGGQALGTYHTHCPGVSHAHLPLGLLVVGVLGHHTCSLGRLPLQCHLPLGVCHLLDLHGDLHGCRRWAGLGLLLLGLPRHGDLAWGGLLLGGLGLLLRRGGRAQPRLALGLGVERRGPWGSVGVGGQAF